MMSFFSPQHLLNIFFARRLDKYDLIIAHGFFSGLIAVHSKTRVHLIFWDPTSTMIQKIYEKTWLRFCIKIATWFDLYVAKKADRIIIASTYHRDWFMFHSLYPKIVPPGCEPKFSKKKREKIIVAVDRWDKGSDPTILLDMIPKGYELIICGKWIGS